MKRELQSMQASVLSLALMGVTAATGTVTVNSLQDLATPPPGTVTLRSALTLAADGEPIVFDPTLNGCTIKLSLVGEEHSRLRGEVMGMTNAPSGPISYLVGYMARDYGRSALYSSNNVVIDASGLPLGITLAWTGGDANPARVLAVHGNLTLKNVSITGGRSVGVELPPPDPEDEYGQLSTRARGAAVAVWGRAELENCRLYDNHCSRSSSVPARQRDSGVFGGGIYADIVNIRDSVISGNSVIASGVSGGGVFSVGGADLPDMISSIERSAVTGNHIAGIFAYGGGVYSDGGGIGKLKTLKLRNCTIARNRVMTYGPGFLLGIGYWRGGGIYTSNGRLRLESCTVVENEVHGVPRTDDLGKFNLAGGIAATIGNAHAVEDMSIGHSIIAGNTVHESTGTVYEQDLFTGSLFQFISLGYNRIGRINFSQILVPVGKRTWYSLCRRHFPEQGDQSGVALSNVVDLAQGVTYAPDITSAGVSNGNPTVLSYAPAGDALDQLSSSAYVVKKTYAEYELLPDATNDFLEIMLGRIESEYALTNFATTFTTNFESFLASVDLDDETPGNQPYTDPDGDPILTLADTDWFGPTRTWPSYLWSYPYIEFWHRLDAALEAAAIPGMGQELLGDDDWEDLFQQGLLAENTNIMFYIWNQQFATQIAAEDQWGHSRPTHALCDIGAVEYQPPPPPSLHWDLEEGSGTNTLEEVSGEPSVTRLIGSCAWTDPLAPSGAYAVDFGAAGSVSFIEGGTLTTNGTYVADDSQEGVVLAGGWTFTAWIQLPSPPPAARNRIVASSDSGTANSHWAVVIYDRPEGDAELGFCFATNRVDAGLSIPREAPVFIAVAGDSSGLDGPTNRHRFAVWDGCRWQSSSGGDFSPVRLQGIELGAVSNGVTPFEGVIDDVRIHERALTQEDLDVISLADSDGDGQPDFLDQDDDGDGIRDEDEMTLGTDPKAVDSDLDGVSDSDEILAGTDPLNGNSRFAIESIEYSTTNVVLRWSSTSNRTYVVLASTNLGTSQWQPLTGSIGSNPPQGVHTTPAPTTASHFYRVGVE